jgi:glycosyltransferase involved in cell wall biosynthesis
VKLVYDMRILTGRMHGMARYGLELLQALLDEDQELQAGVLVRKPEDAQWLPADKRIIAIADNMAPYSIRTQFRLPNILNRMQPEIYHCPFYAAPGYWIGPLAMTIHDLIHLRFLKHHGYKHRLFYRWFVGPAARRARVVFTVSEHSKKDVVELLGVDPARVVISPNGVGEAFKPLDEAGRKAAVEKLGWPGRYILGVGNPKPHKNMAALVEAYRMLKAGNPQAPDLVLVGLDKPGQAGIKRDDKVIFKPHLDDAELAMAYAAASAVCIPSLYEGFGLPALEAMACGAPLVASNRASLPEVVGQAGLLAEPEPEALVQGLTLVLEDDDLKSRLRDEGPKQAARFTWAKAARITLDAYRKVAGGKAPQ